MQRFMSGNGFAPPPRGFSLREMLHSTGDDCFSEVAEPNLAS